jgi:hypothetical protein
MRAHRDKARYESGAANWAGDSFEGPFGVCAVGPSLPPPPLHSRPHYAEQMHCHPERIELRGFRRRNDNHQLLSSARTVVRSLAVLTRLLNLMETGF